MDRPDNSAIGREEITDFSDLLNVADSQTEPQRLLFVFAAVELPENPSKEQAERYAAQRGGCLVPVMYVSMSPQELGGFNDLEEGAGRMGKHWDMLFVAALSGKAGSAPSLDEAQENLRLMIESIQVGMIENFLVFDRAGKVLNPVAA